MQNRCYQATSRFDGWSLSAAAIFEQLHAERDAPRVFEEVEAVIHKLASFGYFDWAVRLQHEDPVTNPLEMQPRCARKVGSR
jgi:hypothetical protein